MLLRLPCRPVLVAASLAGLFCSAGCASSDVNGRDRSAIFPTLRAVFDLDELRTGDVEPDSARPRRRFRQGLEIELGGTVGDFNIDSGIGKTDYTALHGSAAYRFGIAASRVQVFGLLGIGVDRIRLSGNPMFSLEESYLGPMFGVEGRVLLRDWVSPYVRLTGFLMEESSHSAQFETGLLFPAFSHADLFVGYRSWEAEYGNPAPGGRDVDVDWRGVVLGCSLRL